VQSQLENFGKEKNQKSKSVVMSLVSHDDKSFLNSIFCGWFGFTVRAKSEKHIRDKFEKEIADTELKLFEYKQRQLGNTRGVLNRKALQTEESLKFLIWSTWITEIEHAKHEKELSTQMEQMSKKLQNVTQATTDNTKKVMARMSAGSDASLTLLCLQSWFAWLVEYRKDKELEDQVKEAEKRMGEFLKQKGDGRRGVLDRMSGDSDSGVVAMIMKYWVQAHHDGKKEREMQDLMNEKAARFGHLNGRQGQTAMSMQERVTAQANANMCLRIVGLWRLAAKMEKIKHHYDQKIDGKKKQLSTVQNMFRSFAHQLETGLGPDTPSAGKKGDHGSKHSAHRLEKMDHGYGNEGGVQLPDIHTRPIQA
jgi:hypothetical protein